MTEICERCKREAPPIAASEYVLWKAVELDDGSGGVICPGCLTAEERYIDFDMGQADEGDS